MKTIGTIAVALVVCVGCDYINDDSVKQARLEQQRVERENEMRAERVQSLKTYVSEKVRLVNSRSVVLSNSLVQVIVDANELEKVTARVMSSVDENGKELSYEVRVLRLLKNETVNLLAIKYLSGGFAAQAEEFIAKVRDARALDQTYREAVRKVDAQYELAMQESEKWVGMSKSQRDSEIRRLENEIATIEKRRAVTRREMVAVGSQRREWLNKMQDFENEVQKKRLQIDYLRNPDVNRRIETRAAGDRQYLTSRANDTRREQQREIDRRLKPTITILEIAEAVRKDTLEVLRSKIKGQVDNLRLEMKGVDKKLVIGQELLISLPVSGLAELDKLKARADKELSLQ